MASALSVYAATPATITSAGLRMVESFEGCVLHFYLDRAGVPTVGWGDTGPDVVPGLVITQAEADHRLATKTSIIAARIGARLRLAQCRVDALTSFAYNEGLGALYGSKLWAACKQGAWTDAAAHFHDWRFAHVDGVAVELQALIARRAIEARMFITGAWQ